MGINGPSDRRINPANEAPISSKDQKAGVQKYKGIFAKIWEKFGFATKVEYGTEDVTVGNASLRKFIWRQMTPQEKNEVGDWRKVSLEDVKNLNSYRITSEKVKEFLNAESKEAAYWLLAETSGIDVNPFDSWGANGKSQLDTSDKLKILHAINAIPLSESAKVAVNAKIKELRPTNLEFTSTDPTKMDQIVNSSKIDLEGLISTKLDRAHLTSIFSSMCKVSSGSKPTTIHLHKRPMYDSGLSESQKNELAKTPIETVLKNLVDSITDGSPMNPQLFDAHGIEVVNIEIEKNKLKLTIGYK